MRVIHFVTAGFSGATNVARDIILACNKHDNIDSLMVLRRRSSTKKERIQQFKKLGIDTQSVTGRVNLLCIYQLYKICQQFKPDIIVVHGFSEHLWGRYSGLIAKVPYIVHVEHNSKEPYTWWRKRQARWLDQYTDAIIGCSEGVKKTLLSLGCPAEKTTFIENGIDLTHFNKIKTIPFDQRRNEILMASRFAKQKDHATLINAMALLKNKGCDITLKLAGEGNSRHIKKAKLLVQKLRLNDRVSFLGHCSDLPKQLSETKFFVLSTHYEGMPLALIEAMAAGCATIASEVVGVQEMIEHNIDGCLVEAKNAYALADTIERLINNPLHAQQLAKTGQDKVAANFTIDEMAKKYQELFQRLIKKRQ